MNIGVRMVCAAAVVLAFAQCGVGNGGIASNGDALPPEPDYSDTTQWYITDRHGKADLFYVISTETGDYTLDDSITYHYANTYNDSVRGPLLGEMKGVERLVCGEMNFFSPYYRQCSMQSYTSDSMTLARMPVPTEDVRRALDYYLKNKNDGRPFVLAGYSQGAIILLDLVKELDDEAYSRMVALYAIGATVSKEMLEENKDRIKAARCADDTGVTICYNSVRDNKCALKFLEESAVAINPVNWCVDSTPATLITEPSPLRFGKGQKKDTLTVHLDTVTGLLNVSGFTGKDYVLPLIGREGNYHSREVWLYRNQLKDNMKLRSNKMLNSLRKGVN